MKSYPLPFWLLAFSSFFFFSSFNMIIPELPAYLERMGGGDYKGLIIALFTVTAGLSRPFSGKLTDNIGRVPVMIFGVVICIIVGFLYPFTNTIFWFLMLRMLHGFSTGFKPTGTTAYAADIIEPRRRGEALGLLGFFGNTGMAFGPALGGWVANEFGTTSMFYLSSFMAFLSIIILIRLPETLKNPSRLKTEHLYVRKNEIVDPKVIPAGIVMMLSVFIFGVALTIIPDFSMSIGIENKGMFFTYYTISSLIARVIAGKLSDRYGRVPVLMFSTIFASFSCVLLAMADSIPAFFIAALIFGFAAGSSAPTVFAWAIDLGDPNKKGRALSTLFLALEIGVGSGALVAGWLFSNKIENIPFVFSVAAVLPMIAFVYLLIYRNKTARLAAGNS